MAKIYLLLMLGEGSPAFPGSLISIIITTVIVLLFKLPVETIGSQFGSVPNTFEKIQFPNFTFKIVKELFYPSLTIALLAGIESLLSAVVAEVTT